jgi:uncharacterized membrane-anchored protein
VRARLGLLISMTTHSATSKLPQITLAFWITKISATTLGETAGDLLAQTMNVGYAVSTLILMSFFAVTLAAQLAVRRHHVWLYWTVILSTSTAGTTMSDYMDRTLGLGYATGSAILVTLLVAVLALWRYSTGSLSVDDVQSRKAEVFYWVAILFSNTLGTALGDFLADDSGLGFGIVALILAAILGVIILLHFFTKISKVALFWAAFVLTRPLGATAGDFMTKSHERGGLDLGTLDASLVLVTILVCSIAASAMRQRREQTSAATNGHLP